MPFNSIDVQGLTRMVAGGLLNSLFAGLGIAALACFLARLAARDSSAARFAVWFVALIAITLLPWVGSVAAAYRSVPAPATGVVTLPQSLAHYVVVIWMIGAALGLAHVAHGLYRLRRLRNECTEVNRDQLDPAMRTSLDEVQPSRRVALYVSDAVRVPAAIGYFRPLVVVPSWALAEIAPHELNAILLHELAHLRRYDDWTNLAQKLVKAVFFFHPAVWFIESRLTLEREMACDEAVLAANFSPRAYAESLVGLAEKSFLRRGIQLAQAAVGQVRQLKFRLVEILRKDKHKVGQGSARLGKPALALMSLAGIILVYGAAHAPHLIAFSSDASQIASATPAADAKSVLNEPWLKPVNLIYSDHLQPSNRPVDKVKPAHLRITHRAAPQQRMVFTVRSAAPQVMDDDTPSPRMLLSNFPIELDPAPVLVVFQGEQCGANGTIFWRVTVVHLTPAQQRAITRGVPKQI